MSKLGLQAQILGAALSRGSQADDARGATQVLGRGGQAVARGSCLSQELHRCVQAAARGAVPCVSQLLDRGAKAVARGSARCESHVLDRGAQAVTQKFLRRRDAVAAGEK
jgi:hypothetical protein